jgi:RNA polymerase sigma-70 factor (ECF subfamily)
VQLRSVSDCDAQLAQVYRDYPGLLALILRRVHDREVAADILQDAAITTLEKLRNGEIARPENLGGYLYRVALNHLRNYLRKARTGLASADGLDDLIDPSDDLGWVSVERCQWASAVRQMLDEMPIARDREILIRFYLQEESKEQICQALRLSRSHFNRVIFRARSRFGERLHQNGFSKVDWLVLLMGCVCVWEAGAGMLNPTADQPPRHRPITAL